MDGRSRLRHGAHPRVNDQRAWEELGWVLCFAGPDASVWQLGSGLASWVFPTVLWCFAIHR